MGEGRLAGDESTSNRRLTVPEARLGITEAAVRGRIKHETLRSHREAGAVYVLLQDDEPSPNRDKPAGKPNDQSERVEDLREQVAYLRRQLDEEREARRRADTILVQLSAANAEQARTIRAIEAPTEAPEDSETVEEAPEGSEALVRCGRDAQRS